MKPAPSSEFTNCTAAAGVLALTGAFSVEPLGMAGTATRGSAAGRAWSRSQGKDFAWCEFFSRLTRRPQAQEGHCLSLDHDAAHCNSISAKNASAAKPASLSGEGRLIRDFA
jgi:hypothetical protein